MSYTYPHVEISTKALTSRTATTADSTATTLLAPFMCEKGPANELVNIDSMASFEDTFGDDFDYAKATQRQILNIANWIAGGGRVKALRIATDNLTKTAYKTNYLEDTVNSVAATTTTAAKTYAYYFTAKAKYNGSFYDNLVFTVDCKSSKSSATPTTYTVRVFLQSDLKNPIEIQRSKTLPNIQKYFEYTSEYITDFKLEHIDTSDPSATATSIVNDNIGLTVSTTSNIGSDTTHFNITKAADEIITTASYEQAMITTLKTVLSQPLETPFDMMIDCGYSNTPTETTIGTETTITPGIKEQLIDLFSHDYSADDTPSGVSRRDAFLYLCPFDLSADGLLNPENSIVVTSKLTDSSCDMSNVAMTSSQYAKVLDIVDGTREVYVPINYFVSNLIPYNDATYGVQYPTAGLTRGVVSDALWISSFPSASEKQAYYDSRQNYIEKDSRGTYIMCQLTYSDTYDALRFINNERSLLKIKRNLELLGRQYLFEYNDRITKTNLLNTLNSYLSEWIQNRTLSYGSITLEDSSDDATLTDEQLRINLDIKFTNTIEVISVNIVIEG